MTTRQIISTVQAACRATGADLNRKTQATATARSRIAVVLRERGCTWTAIAEAMGCGRTTAIDAYARWCSENNHEQGGDADAT